MCIHKNLIFGLSICLLTGCAATYAPSGWLPDTDKISSQAFGGWMTVVTLPDTIESEERWLQYGGEFIADDDINLYLLFDSLYIIPKIEITKVTLELDQKTPAYGIWTLGGILSTASHGYYMIVTTPLWLISGISVTAGESARDRYETENPEPDFWTNVRKFARFPMGIPENIDLKNLRSKMNFN